MPTMYANSVAWTAVTAWAASTAYSVGNLRRQLATPTVGNERVWRCTTAGTSGGSEPAWTLTAGSTTNDNTAVWTEVTGQEAYQAPGAWGAPHARIANAAASGWHTNGDTIYYSSNHSETQATAITITIGTLAAPSYLICVDETASGHIPPQAADVKTTPSGTIASTTSSGVITLAGVLWGSGGILSPAAANCAMASANSLPHNIVLKNFSVRNGNAIWSIGSSGNSASSRIVWDNVNFNASNAGANIVVAATQFNWKNTASALPGTVPTTLFGSSVVGGATVLVEGVDLSAAGSGKTLVAAQAKNSIFKFKDCKLGASVTIAATPTNMASYVTTSRSDSAGVNYRSEGFYYPGNQTIETTIVRTGGASDGTTALAWNLTTNANAKWVVPVVVKTPLAVWNSTTGANRTLTVQGVMNAAALPTNADIWMEGEALTSSGSPLGSFVSNGKDSPLHSATNHTASTEAWDSLVTARANSTAYSVGNVRKVASNPGRIFFVTAQTGNSAASEPAGFATAVDGGSVTDGNVTWRAGMRFSMAVTFSSPQPQMIGAAYAYLHAAAASATFYLDPKIVPS